MTNPNVSQQTPPPAQRATFTHWGVAYKVAIGVMMVGVMIVIASPFVGGILGTQVIAPLLEQFLNAPADRDVFNASDTQAGVELLALLGIANVIMGLCLFCLRLVLETLGLAGAPGLTYGMRPPSKMLLSIVAIVLSLLVGGLFTEYILTGGS